MRTHRPGGGDHGGDEVGLGRWELVHGAPQCAGRDGPVQGESVQRAHFPANNRLAALNVFLFGDRSCEGVDVVLCGWWTWNPGLRVRIVWL